MTAVDGVVGQSRRSEDMDVTAYRARLRAATAEICAQHPGKPRIGLILGSGLGGVAQAVADATIIPYDQIPGFPVSTVKGHEGRLVLGVLEGHPVMLMQGRVHYYEGYSMAEVVFPVRVMQSMGIEILVVTNAAGGLNPTFEAGDLMLITDHINLVGMTGLNPLRGPNLDEFGPRFPDMSIPYDMALREVAQSAAREVDVPLRQGVYICLSGPSFESPADLRFLRLAGADAVGMSTVPEVTAARHGGTRVLGISGITNMAVPDEEAEAIKQEAPDVTSLHEEVLAVGKVIVPRMEALVRGVLRGL
jgi:purine-nucleoside phosphorylase